MSRILSQRGGSASRGTRYEDMIQNIAEAAALLRRPISQVQAQAEAGELPVEGCNRGRPYFRAGAIMAIAGVAAPTPAVRKTVRAARRAEGWYWIKRDADDPGACALWEEGSRSFWLHGEALDETQLEAVGPQVLPPQEFR